MIFFLVSFVSFLLLVAKPRLPSWAGELRLLSSLLLQESLHHSVQWINRRRRRRIPTDVAADAAAMDVLDLPDLALDLILEKLPPAGLASMSSVCSSLRQRCTADRLWERHFADKWGPVAGRAARAAWEARPGPRRGPGWPWSKKEFKKSDSVMAWYLALESGRLWFPAQVYNREQNGHVGFLLSCYDAELSYDARTDTFQARYAPHGQRAACVEAGVGWDRLRAPPVETPAHALHASGCLRELRPGDHVEIQWRRNKEFPYGWWYGVVGHLESCDGDERRCRCFDSETIILEFNQYSPGSRWRRTVIDRKDHREEGNESDGFYGGIRKLYDQHEISTWRRLWPAEVLE